MTWYGGVRAGREGTMTAASHAIDTTGRSRATPGQAAHDVFDPGGETPAWGVALMDDRGHANA